MKSDTVWLIIKVLLFSALIVIVILSKRSQPKPSVAAPKTLEQRLELLAQCGIHLNPPFTVDDLLKMFDRSEYEKLGWDMVLVGLGTTEEEEPWRNHCVNLWHFDTECIEDNGDYQRIAQRMAEMAMGSLPLEDIKDHVDIENNKAWLSFKLQGKDVRIDCKVEDDWIDPSVLSTFVELLGQSDKSKVFIYYNLGGQDCILGCVTKSQLTQLNKLGIKFEALR